MNKQEVSAPMNFNEMNEQVKMFAIANNVFFGTLSVGSQCLRALFVIGHGIGGKVIPAKMVQLAESQLLE